MYKKLLLDFVSKAYGQSEEDLLKMIDNEDGTVSDDALSKITTLHKLKIDNIKKDVKTTTYDEAYKEAKKKERGKIEKLLVEKYKISDGDGMKLEDIVQSVIDQATSVTEEQIKSHPTFLSLEQSLNNKIKEKDAEHERQLNELKEGYSQKEKRREILSKGRSLLSDLNLKLPSDSNKATAQIDLFLENAVSGFDFIETDGGLVIKKDGKRVEDEFGNPVKFDEYIKSLATGFFDVAEPKGGSGGNRNIPSKGGNVPTTEEEYNTAIFNATSQEERETLAAAWESFND